MKVVILSIVVVLLSPFVEAFVCHHAHASLAVGTLPSCTPAKTTRLFNSENAEILKAIYDIENVTENNTKETLKAGMRVTNLLRNIHLEYLDNIDSLDKESEALKDQTEELEQKKLYVKFAYDFMNHFVRTGRLKCEIEKDEDDEEDETSLFFQAKSIFDEDFDREAFQECVAKHGFQYVGSRWKRNYGYDEEYFHSSREYSHVEITMRWLTEPETATDEPVDLLPGIAQP